MYNPKKLVLTLAEVGHHGELMAKLVYSWFNVVDDDVKRPETGYGIKFTKASITPYGKPFLYGLLFVSGEFDRLVKIAVNERRNATQNIPLPKLGDTKTVMNVAWPMVSTIHLKDDDHTNMIPQMNNSDADYFDSFSPYGNIDADCREYLNLRQHMYQRYYDPNKNIAQNLEESAQQLSRYNKLTRTYHVSLIYDIVHGTKKSLDDLKSIFKCDSVTSYDRLESWLDVAHEVYNARYLEILQQNGK